MKPAVQRVLHSFALVLGLTCLAKALTLVLAPEAYQQSDPLFGFVRFRFTLAGAAFLEYAVLLLVLFQGDVRIKLAAVAWLSSLFVLYRIGVWLKGTRQGCGCLGALPDLLGIPTGWADAALAVVLAYLALASFGLLVALGRRSGSGGRALTETAPT